MIDTYSVWRENNELKRLINGVNNIAEFKLVKSVPFRVNNCYRILFKFQSYYRYGTNVTASWSKKCDSAIEQALFTWLWIKFSLSFGNICQRYVPKPTKKCCNWKAFCAQLVIWVNLPQGPIDEAVLLFRERLPTCIDAMQPVEISKILFKPTSLASTLETVETVLILCIHQQQAAEALCFPLVRPAVRSLFVRCPSVVRLVTTISRDAICLYVEDDIRWNFPKIFTMWVGTDEKFSKVRA